MGVRNSEEFGENLINIATKLLDNTKLCQYLKNTSENPLYDPIERKNILHNNIRVVPLVKEEENNAESTLVLIYNKANINEENTEFDKVHFSVLAYVPLKTWIINDKNLRPFLIISELERSLKGKRVEGLGKLKYHGWELEMITDIMGCFRLRFSFDSFN